MAHVLPEGFRQWPIYASDLKRTIETAHLLHGGHCSTLITSPLLREISLGHWEGKLRSEVQATETDLFHTFKHLTSRFSISGGESFQDVQLHGLEFIKQICRTESANNILVVSHRGLIKSVLSFDENRSLDEIWSEPTIPNCSVSIVELRNKIIQIHLYGSVFGQPSG